MNRHSANKSITELTLLRSIQAAWKASLLYSPSHPSAAKAMVQAYDSLRRLFDNSERVGFGFNEGTAFVNHNPHRDKALDWIASEFEKRHLASVVLEGTVTSSQLQEAIGLLSAGTADIEKAGGALNYYQTHAIPGITLVPRTMQAHAPSGLYRKAEMRLESSREAEPMGETAQGIDALLMLAGERDVHTDWTEPSNLIATARRAVARSLSGGAPGFQSAYQSLVVAIEQVKPQRIVSVLPFEQASALAGKGAQDVAVELTEDFTAEWTADQLATSKPGIGDQRIISAAEATHIVSTLTRREQLARKLAQNLRLRPADPAVVKEFEEQLRWASMTLQQRTQKMNQAEEFSDAQFHLLLQHVRELLRRGQDSEAVDVAFHYFSFLRLFPEQMNARAIERSPSLLLLFPAKAGGELQKRLAQPFIDQFKQPGVNSACHAALAHCVPALVELAAKTDDYDTAAALGAELENWTKQDKALHKSCCEAALSAFLSSQICNNLVQIFLEKRSDANAKMSTSLLRMSGATGAEAALSRLEHEESASQRRALMRLLGLMGTAVIVPARKRLSNDKWYLVRNICTILSDVKDPEMAAYFKPALCHRDPRVQQAAFTALSKTRAAGRAQLMAEALPMLAKPLLEPVLDELMFVKDPACLPALEEFAFQQSDNQQLAARVQQVIKTCRSAAASA